MKVNAIAPETREIQLIASIDELVVLYNATRKGRRSNDEQQALTAFGDLLMISDVELKARIAIEPET